MNKDYFLSAACMVSGMIATMGSLFILYPHLSVHGLDSLFNNLPLLERIISFILFFGLILFVSGLSWLTSNEDEVKTSNNR